MSSFNDFWQIVVDVWNTGILGIDLGRVFVAVGILLFFVVLRRLFIRIVVRWMRSLAKRSETELDDKIIEVLEDPIGLVPLVFGLFLASQYLQLDETFALLANNFIKSIIIVIIFWSLHRLVGPLSLLLGDLERLLNRELVGWLLKAIRWAIVFVGAAAVLETWGIRVAPLLAGLGILGVAVALGAQDLFKNLIAGLLIIAERRFSVREWIKADGVVEGTVEKINFRSTLVRRFDKAPVQVPNSMLSDGPVTNFSRMTHRRIRWIVGVEYHTTVPQLRRIRDEIEEYILNNKDFADRSEVSTFVRIDSFNDSSIDILVYCFTASTNWGEWLEIKEKLAYKIKGIVEDAGSGFAFPSQSVYVETLPGGGPEPFIPPKDTAAISDQS